MLNSGTRNEDQYRSLLKRGYSTEKAKAIVNMSDKGEKSEKAKPYNEWTKEELYQLARKVGIQGRSYMNKKNLVASLRNIQN